MMALEGKKKSPYQRYNKKAYRYSAEYNRWREAIRKGYDAEVKRADQAWRSRFHLSVSYQLAA